MAKLSMITLLSLLALVCRLGLVAGEQDCLTTVQGCTEQFNNSDEDERCLAFRELEMCVHFVHERDDCSTFEDSTELRQIHDRYSYCHDHHAPSDRRGGGNNAMAVQASVLTLTASLVFRRLFC